ncbi:MAG: rhodanese domain-containing protein, partial [Simkaniaceae bacterium]|nr:rhodanese domain-containing protein [Simkaniaceae bacterium]
MGYVKRMILAVAFYRFVDVDEPHELIKKHHEVLKGLDARCRIYISEEGINGQLSISENDFESYVAWMESVPCFQGMEYKVDPCDSHAFEKVTIKYREEIVALGRKVNWKNQGEHLSPQKWREMIETKGDDTILIDVRNDYETA